jgi:hypothetical protein
MIITGIGSRKTPQEVLERMDRLAVAFARAGYLLRSGGADGADLAFEKAYRREGGAMEIYLPWKNFNKNPSGLYTVSAEALQMASSIHPAWHRCTPKAKLLHGRNCYQVLGKSLDKPSNVVICWTKGGKIVGGTATAIRLANDCYVPVINLAVFQDDEKIMEWLKVL